MQWTKQQIADHKKAAKLLTKIKDETFQYIENHKNVSEFEVQEFVISKFKKYELTTDDWRPIVSFGKNTSIVHYYATAKKSIYLQPESLIMLDIWARLNKKRAPFADITWMAYYGVKNSREIMHKFDIVIKARDLAISYIKAELKKKVIPTGKAVDNIVRNYLASRGLDRYFLHGTGHPLGTIRDHGQGVYINQKSKGVLAKMKGYTIEPGIYLKNKFGVRSEVDFYINENYKLVVTTEIQKKIVIL